MLLKTFTANMRDMQHSIRVDLCQCCICLVTHKDDYYGWHRPHPCADKMSNDDGFVCSKACGDEWKELNFEEIEEFEDEQ